MCALVAVALVLPVYANPIESTITKIYIQKDNQPVDGPVNFTMNCYGSYKTFYQKLNISRKNTSPEAPVFSYSLNCSSQGCPLYLYYNTWMLNIGSCDIEGTYQGHPFTIRNYSRGPQPDCDSVDEPDCEWDDKQVCDNNLSYTGRRDEDSSECWQTYDLAMKQCDQDMKAQTNISEGEEKYRQCDRKANAEWQECRKSHTYNINLTRSDVLNNPYDKHAPSRYCELRFNIPSDNMTLEMMALPTESLFVPKSPVESLYCSLLSIFGARC